METVIPAEGRTMLIVNGLYTGRKATLRSIDVKNYSMELRINDGPDKGKCISLPYEDASKLAA